MCKINARLTRHYLIKVIMSLLLHFHYNYKGVILHAFMHSIDYNYKALVFLVFFSSQKYKMLNFLHRLKNQLRSSWMMITLTL